MEVQNKKQHTWFWKLLWGAGFLIAGYAVILVVDTLHVRSQLLSGTYDFAAYGSDISGQGGSNVDLVSVYDVATADDPSIGPAGAPLTIVEFADFECPYCRRSFPIIRSLVNTYGDQVRYQFRDFPLVDIHSSARLAAQAGECAHKQGSFWAFHDKLFQNQERLTRQDLVRYANQTGLDVALFESCLDGDASLQEISQDFNDGREAGVLGTPTWFINGIRVAGVIPEEAFTSIIEEILAQ